MSKCINLTIVSIVSCMIIPEILFATDLKYKFREGEDLVYRVTFDDVFEGEWERAETLIFEMVIETLDVNDSWGVAMRRGRVRILGM